MTLFHYPFMMSALCLCLILTGIHTYLGYHVVRRGVIFVDLALAQVAALGASVGMVMGVGEERPVANYLISLGFTFFGAFLFALFRRVQRKVPLEALIGIAYAGAIALALLILEKSATGAEHIKEMLVGTLLTVSWQEVGVVALLYSVIGFAHFLARRPMFLISEDGEKAGVGGVKVLWWDFFFYTTFGVVVTSSVRVAGVLLVFALLVIPAVSAVFLALGTRRRILAGWGVGLLGSVIGLELSLRLDLAAGPSVIAALIGLLLLSAGGAAVLGGKKAR